MPSSLLGRDRTFSIVMAVNRTIASRCNLYDPDSQIFLAFQVRLALASARPNRCVRQACTLVHRVG